MGSLSETRIGIIGAGAIGGAVIDRLLNGAGVTSGNITACETDEARRGSIADRFQVPTTGNPSEAVAADLIVLAVPPLELAKVILATHDKLAHRPLVVSFAAAAPLAFLEAALPQGLPVLRVNPNSPSLVGAGFNPVIYGAGVTGDARALADTFLEALGASIEVADEDMNLYTALTAVGPTYFLPVFDAIVAAGIEGGLSREKATAAACETALGTAALVSGRTESPDALKLYTGLRPLKDGEVRDLVKAAIDDASGRMIALQDKVVGS